MVLQQEATPIIRDPRWYKTLIYGRAGVGKTTWASEIKDHYFIKAEEGTAGVEVPGDVVTTWQEVTAVLDEAIKEKTAGWKDDHGKPVREVKTLIFDTGDALFILASRYICETRTFPEKGIQHKFKRIEDVTYGKGYKAVAELLGNMIELMRLKGFGVVILCHSKEYTKVWRGQDFTAYRPNFPPSTIEALMGACDCVGFMEVDEVYEKNDAGQVEKVKSQRVMHWQAHFLYEAKHRLKGFPDTLEVPVDNGYQAYVVAFDETLQKLDEAKRETTV